MYDYVAGKLDWLAAGLETEGAEASKPTAKDLARRDVATCRLDDTVAHARKLAGSTDMDVCVVVNEANVVLGLLRDEQLAGDDGGRAGDVMLPGPSTFRPHVPIGEMAHYMQEHDVASAPISTSEGKLIGMLFRSDALRAAHEH